MTSEVMTRVCDGTGFECLGNGDGSDDASSPLLFIDYITKDGR